MFRPKPAPWNRFAMLSPAMSSDDPGLGRRPFTSLTCGLSDERVSGDTPDDHLSRLGASPLLKVDQNHKLFGE